jgi:hypothetical protein
LKRADFRRILTVTAILLSVFWVILFGYLRNPNFINGTKIDGIKPDPALLEKHVRALSDPEINRSYTHESAMRDAAAYIENELISYGYKVRRQDVFAEDRIYHNLIARYGDPAAKEVTVVGAHYDAAGENNPGADDNASGVAGLLELARFFSLNKPVVGAPIEFVAYTPEEPPFFGTQDMGSAYHADELKKNGVNVNLMLSLEMIGYFTDEFLSQGFPMPLLYAIYPWTGDFIAIVGSPKERETQARFRRKFAANSGVPAYGINAPSFIQGTDFSDHRNYQAHGWPALMITDTAFLRNTEYHQPGDTADRLNYKKMAEVVAGVFAALQ